MPPTASLAPPFDPTTAASAAADYARIEKAIVFLSAHAGAGSDGAQPSLDQLAAHLKLSPFHLHRLFTRWAGISPKRFLQALTVEHAKAVLSKSRSVLEGAYAAGLSSPGRLHDLFVHLEAVTPGEFKSGGVGVELSYGSSPTPFGTAFLAWTDRGLVTLQFVQKSAKAAQAQVAVELAHALTEDAALAALQADWPAATVTLDQVGARRRIERIFRRSQHDLPPIRLHLRGTNLQIQVWRALLKIPEGAAVTYQDLAKYLGRPTASRAVANAIGRNPVAWLIPCHRVLRGTGALGGYRWGEPRKQALLARETNVNVAEAQAIPDRENTSPQ